MQIISGNYFCSHVTMGMGTISSRWGGGGDATSSPCHFLLLKSFDGFRCQLAGAPVGSSDTSC